MILPLILLQPSTTPGVVVKEDSDGWIAAVAVIFTLVAIIVIVLLLFVFLGRAGK
jgi:hypothetical protein